MHDADILSAIQSPADVRALPQDQLERLADQLRQRILEVVAKNGGHLASNLGTVELTIALLRVFDPASDALVWDTGHQAYSYKLLTGRNDQFDTLRQNGGCAAFLHRDESSYDKFGAGHAGTALSAALGFAVARDRMGEAQRVLAVVGDGALGSGVALEGLNSVIETTNDFIFVLNDNRMSIAPNVGALSQYLNRTISNQGYRTFRNKVASAVDEIPVVGRRLHHWCRRMLMAAKGLLTPGAVFEELGLSYIGPLDGHDIPELIRTFSAVRKFSRPAVVHVLTEKGHGYPRAAEAPEAFHGLGRSRLQVGQTNGDGLATESPDPQTFSSKLGETLCATMDRDPAVLAITAGMCHGTGLAAVRDRFPERFFDVGIAEEHAVVFAAGLAAAGMKPVVAIYATFMQRAFDYVFHDVLLQKLPVVFCLDRAGIVDDGATHHGIQDLAWWTALPDLAVLQPADSTMLRNMLTTQLAAGVPSVIRYPKSTADPLPVDSPPPFDPGKAAILRTGEDCAIWAAGREACTALTAAKSLHEQGIDCTVVDVRSLQPFDRSLLQDHAARMPLVTIENHCSDSGLGMLARLASADVNDARLMTLGWPRAIIPGGTESDIRRAYRMNEEAVAQDIAEFVRRRR